MARQPIDRQQDGLSPRERIWAAIRDWRPRDRAPFSAREIAGKAGCDRKTAQDYLNALTAGGWLELTDLDGIRFWTLVRDTGREVPRVRADGSPVTQGRAAEQMWRTMRLIGMFSLSDLIIQAGTDEVPIDPVYAARYLRSLISAGYLWSYDGGRYRLIPAMNTGPKPPAIQRTHVVYDANLGRVMWSAAGGRVPS